MRHDIAFLHTAAVHVETFSQLVSELETGISVRHIVDEKLLEDACRLGITPALCERIDAAMLAATSTGAEVVVCTCSTIGGVAEQSGARYGFKSVRIDRAMANEAVKISRRILVVAALESTLGPTRELIEDSAKQLDNAPEIDVLHIEGAWRHFENGESEAYHQAIAAVIKACWQNYDAIVLAQASMAKASELCDGVDAPILSSPRMGVHAAASEIL